MYQLCIISVFKKNSFALDFKIKTKTAVSQPPNRCCLHCIVEITDIWSEEGGALERVQVRMPQKLPFSCVSALSVRISVRM